LGNLTLAPGQTVHLVAVGPDVLVVGQNAGGLTTLARYPRAEFDAPTPSGDGAAYPAHAPASTPAASFADVLGGYGIRLPGAQSGVQS
jgi:flagellar biogenesis protein FliO